MIIQFPTALYKSVLPSKPEDDQSVTWLISSTNPPRATDSFQRLPIAEELRSRPDGTRTEDKFRDTLGDLLFTTTSGSQSATGTGKKQFEVGSIIEAGSAILPEISNTLVPAKIVTQHNTNLVDLTALNLTVEEAQEVTSNVEKFNSDVRNEINILQTQINNTKVQVRENQKSLNETNKAIEAVLVAFSNPTESDVLSKLEDYKAELEVSRTQLVNQLNFLNGLVQEKYDSMLKVTGFVR